MKSYFLFRRWIAGEFLSRVNPAVYFRPRAAQKLAYLRLNSRQASAGAIAKATSFSNQFSS
jgi:hypothetical protein